MTDKPRGKPCFKCSAPLINLCSMQVRMCSNGKCGNVERWQLEDGRPPLLASNRDVRKDRK